MNRTISLSLSLLLLLLSSSCGSSKGNNSEATRFRVLNLSSTDILQASSFSRRQVQNVPEDFRNTISTGDNGTFIFDTAPRTIASNIAPLSNSEFFAISDSSYLAEDLSFLAKITLTLNTATETDPDKELRIVSKVPANFDYSILAYRDSCVSFDRVSFNCIAADRIRVEQVLNSSANSELAAIKVNFIGRHFTTDTPIRAELRKGSEDFILATELSDRSDNLFSSGYLEVTPGRYNILLEKPSVMSDGPTTVSIGIELKKTLASEVYFYFNEENSLSSVFIE